MQQFLGNEFDFMFKCELKKVYKDICAEKIKLWDLTPAISCDLLLAFPELVEKDIEWDLTDSQWLFLLLRNDSFAKICDWGSLPGNIWSMLLRKKPYLSEYCDRFSWSKLSSLDWANLLKKQPQFSEYCPDYWVIKSSDWVKILKIQPMLLENCPLEKLTLGDYQGLLAQAS